MQQGFGILHTVSSSYLYQLTSAWTLLSRFPAAVSLLLTVPNDDSGILSVIPSALFISKAVRATGSLHLSIAGGDTPSLVEPSHSDAVWAALQHGVSAASRWRRGSFQVKVSMKDCFVCAL